MIDVIYEDSHLLVLNKPSGLLTQESGSGKPDLETIAKAFLKDKYQKQGNVFLQAIHRLDTPVSGIVVFAKTSKALSRLNESLREHKTSKRYLALVEGKPKEAFGTLKHYLVHGDHQAALSSPKNPKAKLCELSYETKKTFGGKSLLSINLQTGRYHQIRAQLGFIGCPIVGDSKYGSKIPFSEEGIALCHYSFSLPHPITKKIMTFTSPNGIPHAGEAL